MHTVTMEEAQAQLPELIEAAAQGEPFQIERAGELAITVVAFAQTTPVEKASFRDVRLIQDRRLGTLEGQFTIPDDFDTYMQDEIIALFENDGKL